MKKLLILALAALLSWSARAADEVKLLRSQSTVSSKYGINFQSIRFEALVKNIVYAKEVYAHLKRGDGSWVDVPLAYQRQADSGREVWAGNYIDQNRDGTGPSFQTFDLEFALRYRANGIDYWDNNNGVNYRQARDSGSLLVGATVLNRTPDGAGPVNVYYGQYQGSLTIKNLAPTKQVKVLYTTDGWQTSNTAWASYLSSYWLGSYSRAGNPNQYGAEEWSYSLTTGTSTKVEYVIGYVVNGTTYWDNNFGRNYSQQLNPFNTPN